MSKRAAEDSVDGGVKLKDGERPQGSENGGAALEYEDDSEEDYESEDEIFEAGVDGRLDEEREAEEKRDAMDVDQRTFIPGRDKLQKGESLSPDLSTYEMLHTLTTTWPCLSFDIIRDSLGDNRKAYPATVYAVAGTQAESRKAKENELLVIKLSGLTKVDRDIEGSDSEEDDDDDEEDSEPTLETKSIRLPCTTNRIRAHQVPSTDSSKPPTTYTATMLENGQLQIHNITPHLSSLNTPNATIPPSQSNPIATLKNHKTEGYALAWSPLFPHGSSSSSKILSGDNAGNIFVTSGNEDSSSWSMDARPFTGHHGSIEDIEWSPNELHVFASASSDGTVKIWDLRSKGRTAAISVQVSDVDVNVLSWSKQTAHLLATGADNGQWAVWDLRHWKAASSAAGAPPPPLAPPKAVASFDFHKEQITSVEWHPTDNSIVAVAAGDNTLTLWDLAVELDDEESKGGQGANTAVDAKDDVPPQLLFIHVLDSVKECHWHPQIPGVVMGTGGSGFGVFKTISV